MDEACDRLLKVKKSCNIAPGVVDLSVIEDENSVKGGILSNHKLSWVSCGPRITNLNNNNGSKKTGWTFGWASGDKSIRVVCVEELPGSFSASPILVVGYESENSSCLCFYHSGCSRVLKAIHFSDKITSLGVVSKASDPEEGLCDLLTPWSGIVAVGTNIGKVYLVDVCWRALEKSIEDLRHKLYDEQRQSKLVEVTIRDVESDLELRTSSVRHGSSSLALWLNEVTFEHGRRAAHPGLHNVLGRMPLEFLTVSALKYFPQISTLAVGYNTSCFQLWDLSSLTLLYTSALLEAMLPVFSFSLLEPSDDPRFVCYLWSLHHSVDEDNIPFAGMYIISYHEKHQRQHTNQFFYEGFSSCSIRYQLDLGAEVTDAASGRIISCQAIHRSTSKTSALWIQSEAEEAGGEEGTASLLTIAWEVWTPNQVSVHRKLTLFDLNQWYREYMPTSSDMEYSQFMAHFCLPGGQMLDVKVVPSSVRQFQALQPLDEHFYPTATSFECLVLQQSQVVLCSHSGLQQEALEALTDAGPAGLLLPARLYKQCSRAGLRPLLVEIGSPTTLQSSEQRAYLLCLALEHEMTQFLRRCAADWADGSHAVAGCTLPGLLAWAWDRVQRYKKWLDRLCVPLFDYSGSALDTNDLGVFHHMVCQLHRLRDLFHLVLDKYGGCIIRSNFEQQYAVINLVTAFYDSVFWCIRNKVLPEVNANEANIGLNGCVPYFTDKIMNSTITRRAELHQLGKALREPPPHALLLVDAVIAEEAGPRVTDQWEREGGSATLGKYPPPSVQSLLRTYLIRGVRTEVKHFIVTYFLLDVAHVLQCLGASETIKLKLLKYPTDFGLSESQSKIVEAFWCLDHKQYQSGVELLLDSSVSKEDVQVYQHRTVLCLLAAVKEFKLALRYLTSRRRMPTEPQDIRMEMTLLLENDLIHEAFQFQRHHHSMSNELLEQFFKGCMELNKLDVIFKMALTPAEEEAFMAFLDKTCHPQADDLRVLYLLSRSRYVEAIDMNERLHNAVGARRGMGLSGPGSRNLSRNASRVTGPAKTVTTRDLMINSVSKTLPSITRDLADYCHREKHYSWKQIDRPTPLSVVVHTELSEDRLPYYKTSDSQLIEAAVSKTREIWAPLLATPAALKRKLQASVEDTPFLRSHIHPRLNNSLTNVEEMRNGVRSRTEDEESKIAKRARLEFSPSEKEKEKTESLLDKTAEMEITCAESNALLHTPLVPRIVKNPPREINTPQSILKGRSGPNTPMTPGREKLGSPAVARQIRFSLPKDESSSPTKSFPSVEEVEEVEEEEELNSDEGHMKTLSPRKSIHDSSDLQSRLPTPSNPRVLQCFRSLRGNSVSRLQFDELEKSTNESEQVEPTATAATLLNKISSPPSSEEAYFSFQSSSSGGESKNDYEAKFRLSSGLGSNVNFGRKFSFQSNRNSISSEVESKSNSEPKFKVSYGLEGNIDDIESGCDKTYIEENESVDVSVESDGERTSEANEMENTLCKSSLTQMSPRVCENQTNESFNLTLEYKGDESSISAQKLSRTLSQSMNKTSEVIYYNESRNSVKLDSLKYDLTMSDSESEEVQTKEEPMKDFSLVNERMVDEKETVVDSTEEGILENSSILGSNKQTIVSDDFENEVQNKMEVGSSEVSASTHQPNHYGSKLDNSIIETLSEKDLPATCQDSSLTSDVQEVETHGEHNEELESTMPSSNSRLSRGSTPLPQILEELVKKGRISLSVPENKLTPIQEDLHTPNTLNFSKSEKVVTEENEVKSFVESQEKIEIENIPEVQAEENKSISTPEEDNSETSAKGETFPIPFNNSPAKPMFVFGNQENISTFASNLTFTIGTHQFGSTTPDVASETDELSTKNVDSLTRNKYESEPSLEEEPPETTKDAEKQTDSDTQICSASDEPAIPTEVADNRSILDPHSITIEDFLEGKSNDDEVTENIVDTNSTEIHQVCTSDLPEDDQNHGLNFYIDNVGSTSYSTKMLEADSTADFELKMSEGESAMEISCYENNEEAPANEKEDQEEPVFQTLEPVEYPVGEEGPEEGDACFDEVVGEEENENDVDIYGDLEGDKNDVEYEEEYMDRESENEEEEGEKEVICLGSSSDEEPPSQKIPSSTPYSRQLTPKVMNQSQVHNETLDYELEDQKGAVEEDDDDNDEDDDEEEGNESYSSESCDEEQSEKDEGDSKIEKRNLYFSSESDSDTSQRRRSWKEQRNQYDSNESLSKGLTTDEDTVESPPFELISQDNEDKREPMIAESKKEFSDVKEDTAVKMSPVLDAEKESKTLIADLPQNDKDDIIKLAEESRQRRLETGSILDLKKNRSKRYSSVTDLNESKKVKLRRRSCSLHDFMSAYIKETKSSSLQLSPEKKSRETVSDLDQLPSSHMETDELPCGNSTNDAHMSTTQPSVTSEFDVSETASVTSSLLPETGSLISSQTSTGDFQVATVPKFSEKSKNRGKSLASRISSLQDIAEEMSDNAESFRCPTQDTPRKSLRRSLSTDQLTGTSQTDDSRNRRSSSVCRWSEYAKAHESEMTSDTSEVRGDSEKLYSHSTAVWPTETKKMKHSKRKSKVISDIGLPNPSNIVDSADKEKKESCGGAIKDTIQQSEIKELQHEDSVALNNKAGPDDSVANSTLTTDHSRRHRAQSEPSSMSQTLTRSRRSRRNSSTLIINEHHKRILYRSSLRGKSLEPQPFKIIDSDSESPVLTLAANEHKEHLKSPIREDRSKISEDNLSNDQVGLSVEHAKLDEVSEASTSTMTSNRSKRGYSEPPMLENVPKSRPRTRRSSFSQKIEKIHKLVFPRNLRKSRASAFQPMEIVHSDEDKSFQKTPDQVKQDSEQESIYEQNNKEIIETPVTTKKRGRSKKQPNEPKKSNDIAAEETEDKSSPLNIQEEQIANKTTQDYPQPPKKRGRTKNKPEPDIITHNAPPEIKSVHHNEIEIESLSKEVLPVKGNKNVTKVKGKSQIGKKNKQSLREENKSESDDEPLASLVKVDSENHGTDGVGEANKRSGPKRKKTNSKVEADKVETKSNKGKEESESHTTDTTEKVEAKKKNVNDNDSTPVKGTKRKKKDVTPSKETSDNENVESSLTESQADEMAKPPKLSREQELSLDSPARRTRSSSRLSDTDMLTPTKERSQRRTRRSSVMSDVGLSTPNKYAESEVSDASTEVNVRLFTPTRRMRRTSVSATPTTPDLQPEEFLMQRRLTRHQHSQLQKSFELSFAESPKLSMLEEVPEEGSEGNETSLTPVRTSRRGRIAVKSAKSKSSKK